MGGQTSVEVLAKATLFMLVCFAPLLLCYKIREIYIRHWMKQGKNGASLYKQNKIGNWVFGNVMTYY